jgi:uncharacterized protein (TIGR02996 family)
MTDGGALLAAVLEHPGDDTPRLVYADWLDDRGERDRADLIRVQCEIARFGLVRRKGPRRARLFARERELLRGGVFGPAAPGVLTFYRRGFPEVVRPTLAAWQAHAPALLAAHPLERVDIADVPGLTFEVRRDAPGWVLAGRLVVPGAEWRRENGNADRVWLVRAAPAFVRDIVDSLRAQAGDRWPGAVETIPPGAVLRTRQGATT